jgi:hypothetical protein
VTDVTATGSCSVVTTATFGLTGLLSRLGLGSTGSKCYDPKMERMENTTNVVNITATAAAGRRTDFVMLGSGG